MYKTFTGNEGSRNDVGDHLYGLIIQRAIKQQAFTCQNTATPTPTIPLQDRKSLQIFNNSDNIIYYGASDVSVANGMPIYPHGAEMIQIEDGIDVYTISDLGGEDIRLVEGS